MAHILLVEDDERLRSLASKVLGRDHVLSHAGTGPDAVRLALEDAPDLVLMDLTLPEFDGLEATRRIKAAAPGLPVVMVTAHAMSLDRERAAAAGCDAFLTKPYALAELVACVDGALRGGAAPA